MELVIVVINDYTKLGEVVSRIRQEHLPVATVLSSFALGDLASADVSVIGRIGRMVSDSSLTRSKTLFVVARSEDVERVFHAVEEVIGDFSHDGTGLAFSVPVLRCRGFAQWVNHELEGEECGGEGRGDLA